MSFWQRIPLAIKILVPGLAAVIIISTIKPAPVSMPPAEAPLPQVAVVIAEPKTHRLKVASQGTVTPLREIDLVAQVGGSVTSVHEAFVDGGFFSQNDTLVQIDDRDYMFAHQRAKGRVAEAEQLLSTERGRVRQAKREWRDLGNAEANSLFLRKPQLAAAEAGLVSAKAELGKALVDLERARITVPFTGRVRETFVDVGQYVTPGTRIATVYDTSTAEIRLPLSDRQAALIDLPLGFNATPEDRGPEVEINGVIGGNTYSWLGHIARTDASIDTRSRMYYAVAEVANPFIAATDSSRAVPLIVGLFVEAEIDGRELENVLELPRDAVFKRDKVYVLKRDDSTAKKSAKVVLKTVQVLDKSSEKIWIRALPNQDILAGTEIVVGQQNYIMPNVLVSVAGDVEAIVDEKNVEEASL